MIAEVLSKDAKAGDWIHDFVHSDNPKFAGKSKTKRKEMALAAYYAKQRNEEVELEEGLGDKLKAAGKKALEKLGHGDDEAMRKDLQKKAGLPQTGKKPTSENVEEAFKGPEAGSGVGDHPFVENSPLNLAKDLAKKSYKKIKQETMMGKIAGGI